MYRISELAESVGVSRATLLYYEKLGLLHGQRQANGYRVYSDADRQRLRLMQQLQAGGLSLKESQACLDGKLDREMLNHRLETLEHEIAEKTRSRDLLAALLGRGSLKDWHEEVERVAPDLHRSWLMSQGFSSAEAGLVAMVSKDMNAHDAYMAGFMEVFSELDRWGPGTEAATLKALAALPFAPETILEIGCGPGMATMTLAEASMARFTATDTAELALDKLRARIAARGLNDRIEVQNVDMAVIPTPKRPWDVIWSEGSAYILGVEKALADWRALLRPGGVLVFSDMVWRTDKPEDEVRAFWAAEYPAMATPASRVAQAKRAGYRVLGHFDIGSEGMEAYYRPLAARLEALEADLAGSRVLDDLRREIAVFEAGRGQFGYEMFVLERV
ncbi:DNA-binding transcriptional MerR regulator [Thioclava sp. ES.031]|uniref:MerR family transcriptional regulator n=1 Tax=Thioclava sp. ES.031 TaxID=1798203 RepID=UPI000BF94A9C|nr:MerR family transcriptional regulator [Thioclava sp. ES.031]PFG63905.1 DNA-binding transcriptional MerR regulator [Thioclava sp. ES.031]